MKRNQANTKWCHYAVRRDIHRMKVCVFISCHHIVQDTHTWATICYMKVQHCQQACVMKALKGLNQALSAGLMKANKLEINLCKVYINNCNETVIPDAVVLQACLTSILNITHMVERIQGLSQRHGFVCSTLVISRIPADRDQEYPYPASYLITFWDRQIVCSIYVKFPQPSVTWYDFFPLWMVSVFVLANLL